MQNFRLLVLTLLFTGVFMNAQEMVFPGMPPYVLPSGSISVDDGQDPMDSRLFRTTTTRKQIDLSGLWNFITDPEDMGLKADWGKEFPEAETSLWIPGTWNATPRYWQYQGPGWYQRTFTVDERCNLRFQFCGVFYRTTVWLDGQLLGQNEGSYSPFALTRQAVSAGNHTITVRVDNSLDDESLPKDGVDWFPYGGIYRPVYAEVVQEVYIDKYHIITEDISSKKANLRIRVFLRNASGKSVKETLRLDIAGQTLYSAVHDIQPAESLIDFDVTLKSPKRWSPNDPNLYSARLVLGDDIDDQFERFGVRSLETAGYRIMLNGDRFKLMGANHHDDHPDWGSALPPFIIQKDIEIMKRMGSNAVRGHYPPSQMFMDFCDRYGLFFMNEVPSWQYRPEQLANDAVKTKIKQQYHDMVYRDMNHPSVFCWSLGNEWREFEKSYDDIKELVDYARTVDNTHFVTFITGGAHHDRSHELIDLICTNWSVYQWYWDATVLDEAVGRKSIAQLNEIHERFPNKPVILTEFGGSGSQAGWHNWGNVKWSEEYQARNVWESGKYALEQEWLSGGCVWQFCDTRTTHARMLGPRLRGWNVKGVVDDYRQPKMSFYKLQELFHGNTILK